MPKLIRLFENFFVAFSLIVFTKAFTLLMLTDLHAGRDKSQDLGSVVPLTANNTPLLTTYLLIYTITGILLLREYSNFFRLCKKHWLLIALIVLTFASAVWSATPTISLARSVALTGTTLFGIYLGLFFERKSQLHLLAISSTIIVLGSLLLIIFFPEQGVMNFPHWGLWNGALVHKNMLGMAMVVASISLFFYAASSESKSKIALPVFIISILLLCGSLAKTSAVAFAATFSLFALIFMARRAYFLANASILAVLLIAGAFTLQILHEKPVAHVFSELVQSPTRSSINTDKTASGASETIYAPAEYQTLQTAEKASLRNATGRAKLWQNLAPLIKEKPLTGFGFGGFWTPGVGAYDQAYNDRGWIHSQAHNGYIEIVLELGVVGLILFLCLFIASLFSAFMEVVKQKNSLMAVLSLGLLVTIGVINLAESQLLMPNSILWIIFVMILVSQGSSHDGDPQGLSCNDAAKNTHSPS